MKNLTKTTLSIIAIVFISTLFIQCKDAAVTKFMELEAEQMNKQCPMNMGNGLTLTKCSIEEDKTIKMHISVPEEIASQLTINDELKAAFTQGIKAQPQLDKIKEFGITYAYAFYDANEKLLGEVKITPDDYK
ncbi:MAG: hypothetical protein ACK5KN_17620 [Dysgonomonas sp.]|jgi:predicted KAP-like P-loop ATPase|uniref:hypothetical protein n=1 Tax=unclassified Dysgonomonas TaxID=2630389 RepID=UPI0025BC3C4D|nr:MULTISPECIES: hypothetical protein [unclassified Dysgonomonas]MDR1717612.1 hypothetical protein [Prevotella sp.]MDR2003687.1 hypothetical protein [Prevotella sp.]HMM01573.1 hypothetical protein [Dysgonomonas sp.]